MTLALAGSGSMPSLAHQTKLFVACIALSFLMACGNEASSSAVAATDQPSGSAPAVAADAAPATPPATDAPPTTGTTAPWMTVPLEATTAPTTASTPEPGSDVLDGEGGSFSTPSGNITCTMAPSTAFCHIANKQWDAERPADCEDDFGHVVELDTHGPGFSCYTDLFWDLGAAPVPYGSTMSAGSFACEVETTGVTCTNGDGQGFLVKRAEVRFFEATGVATPSRAASVPIETTSFTSPSGNITCVIGVEEGVACHVFNNDWKVDAADVFWCDGDFGNGVELNDMGARLSCYSDVYWDVDAEPLPYGTTIAVGEYRCAIETTGVACNAGPGKGFEVSRAEVGFICNC